MLRRINAVWNALVGHKDRPRTLRGNCRSRKLGRTLRFEQCEDRKMLAVLTVDSVTDDGVGTTLRDAIDLINLSLDPTNTINFDATVFNSSKTITLTQGELSLNNSVTIRATEQREAVSPP